MQFTTLQHFNTNLLMRLSSPKLFQNNPIN